MSRSPICDVTIASAALMLSAAAAVAEPATVISAVNIRAGASTASAIIGKIPAGSVVQATRCRDWCEIEWQGRKGFAIATAIDRGIGAPQRGTAAAVEDNAVPMSLPKVDETPQRSPGPYFGGGGPGRGFGYLGWRGRW